jgi:hypothetical protein
MRARGGRERRTTDFFLGMRIISLDVGMTVNGTTERVLNEVINAQIPLQIGEKLT